MISDRIKELRNYLRLSQVEFGKKLGISNTAISKLEKAERKVSDQTMLLICNVFGVNPDWLKNGEPPMFVKLSEEEEFAKILAEIQFSDDDFIKNILRKYWRLPEEQKKIVQQMLTNLTSDSDDPK